MLPQTELKLFSSQINLTLLNDIIAFVLSTSEATSGQARALSKNCIFLDSNADSNALQSKYGFLYLGELLERYEDRFNTSIQDFRAIALALGYTQEILNDSMFVGSQKADFMRKLKNRADGDLYLTGALYLLSSKDRKNPELEDKLLCEYSAVEELIFAVSLLQDDETIFPRVKGQLLRLLGCGHTVSILGNMKALNWLITWLIPHLKGARGKDISLLRALTALPTSFVKSGSKHYSVLTENGYTPLEIAYANMMTVLAQTADGVLRLDSIVTQKIVVALFWEVLGCTESLPSEAYAILSVTCQTYSKFGTRCYGCETLLEALDPAPRISNADTFLWFSKLANIHHPVFSAFDILDTKWDPLASAMEPESYQTLFEFGLNDFLSKEEIQRRINRYDTLTGTSYLSVYQKRYGGGHFNLLVKKGIIDLWAEFQAGLDEEGNLTKSGIVDQICDYAYELPTIQAYQFYEKFFEQYGVQDLDRFFTKSYHNFYSSLVNETRYSNRGGCDLTVKLDQDFLDDDKRRQLLAWLEEYVFLNCPKKYLSFVTAILRNETIAGLFSPTDQRALFDLVITQETLSWSDSSHLKRRYLTDEEKTAEQEAEQAAKQKAEQQALLNTTLELQKEYAEKSDGTFAYDHNFLSRHRYRAKEDRIAGQIVSECLEEHLAGTDYQLNGSETAQFLSVCARLLELGTIEFQTIKDHILMIKECIDHAGDSK